jgi:sugar transferase (PEP-CTERM/EpsH1 system associated)
MLKEISRWANVDVVALVHDSDEASHVGELSFARTVTTARVPAIRNRIKTAPGLLSTRPTTHMLLEAAEFDAAVDKTAANQEPDVVLAYCTGIAPAAFRPALRGVPVILDMVDVDSQKWAAMAATARLPLSWVYARESRLLAGYEAHAARRAAMTLVVNEREQAALSSIAPDARIVVIENGVDLGSVQPRGEAPASKTVVFCGVMNYQPNVDGAIWLGRDVWPLVRQRIPTAQLKILGADPTRSVQALADVAAGVEVTGSVPDVRPHLWSAALAAAPLWTARGIQNKVLEAVAAGLPVVVTPAVMEGLPNAVRPACVEASTSGAFARELADLLELTPGARRAMANAASLAELSWPTRLAGLQALFAQAAQGRRDRQDPDPAPGG